MGRVGVVPWPRAYRARRLSQQALSSTDAVFRGRYSTISRENQSFVRLSRSRSVFAEVEKLRRVSRAPGKLRCFLVLKICISRAEATASGPSQGTSRGSRQRREGSC